MRYIFLILLLFATAANAQFKGDNVKYKTVFPEELCNTLKANPGYLLLDVRSPGEYDDTSTSQSLNIGRMKNAVNIDIRQLPARWKELTEYKDKPVFIYCSHSQRSRRASRLLSDSGFTKIYNINGGLTDFYFDANNIPACTEYLVTQNLPYKIVSPAVMVENVKKGSSYIYIDLREDSVFSAAAPSSKKAQGYIGAAIRMPFSKFDASTLPFTNRPIMLVDEFGNESPKAARMLIEKGFKDVNVLFNGMSEYAKFYYYANSKQQAETNWKTDLRLNAITADAFYSMDQQKKDYVLIDVRSAEEFNNKSKNYWQNIGNIKGAINIPTANIAAGATGLPASKDAAIVIYGFNQGEDVYNAVTRLKELGYKNTTILLNGIWYMRWSAHNLKGKKHLNDLVVNVPEENL